MQQRKKTSAQPTFHFQSLQSSHYTALLEEGSEDQQHKTGSENVAKLLPVYITDTTHTAVRANSKTAIQN
jgi:hypothetical protein